MAFSPNGKWLISGSEDATAKIWEVASGREVRTLGGHGERVFAVGYSPDGRTVATGSYDGTVKLWEVATGQESFSFKNDGGIESVAFSPDGKWLAASSSKEVIMWDLVSKSKRIVSETRSAAIGFSPDAKLLAIGAVDGTVAILDMITSGVSSMTTGGWWIHALAFSPNGQLVATGHADKSIRLVEVSTGRELRRLTGHTQRVWSVAFSPDGRSLASGSGDKTVRLWNVDSGRELRVLKGHRDLVKSVTFSPDGALLASGSFDQTVKLWEVRSGREVNTFGGYTGQDRVAVLSHDGRVLVTTSDRASKVWDLGIGQQTLTLKGSWSGSVALSHDGRLLAARSDRRGYVALQDLSRGGRELRVLNVENEAFSLEFSADGQMLACANGTSALTVWDTASWRSKRIPLKQSSGATSVAFSPDGRRLAARGSGLSIWDVEMNRMLREIVLPVGSSRFSPSHTVAFSPDGELVATGGGDHLARIWEVATGRQVHVLEGHTGTVGAVAFSPNGKVLATAGDDSGDPTVRLWDVATGRELHTLIGHTDGIGQLAFGPAGRRLLSSSSDGTTRLWDPDAGTHLATLLAMRSTRDWLVVTPEGLFDGTEIGMQRLLAWRVDNRVYPPDRYFADYYLPGLLALVFARDELRPSVNLAKLNVPPEIEIVEPRNGAVLKSGRATVRVKVADQGGGVAEVRLYHNGKLIRAASGTAGEPSSYAFQLDLVAGANDLRGVALSRERVESNDDAVKVVYDAPGKTSDMYLLAIGINRYEDPSFDLGFAQPDAEAMARFFQRQGNRLFRQVHSVKLLDSDATSDNIKQALERLARDPRPEDVIMIYIAGHGVGLGQQFYFLTQGMRKAIDEEGAIREFGISASVIGEYLRRSRALKQVLILDTCESESALPILAKAVFLRGRGGETDKALKMLARANGVYLIAASTKQQKAYEVKELGHGVLSYVLLSGLGEAGPPQAVAAGESMVTVQHLIAHANQKVPEFTERYHGRKQYPTSFGAGMDFPLAAR